MANNFNLSNYQYTNTKFVLDGISILLKVQLADWVNLKTMLAALPAGRAIHPGLVWGKMMRDILAL
jgi:hypothetical protein